MSETSQGQGWWLASDGKWYPPDQRTEVDPTPVEGAGSADGPARRTRSRRVWVVAGSITLVAVAALVGVLVIVRGDGGDGPSVDDVTGEVKAVLEFDLDTRQLSAYDPELGTRLWQVEGGPVRGWASDGRFLLLPGRRLEQRDSSTGDVVWSFDLTSGAEQVAVVGDRIVAVSEQDKTVLSIDFRSGEPVWRWSDLRGSFFLFGGGRIVVEDTDRRIVALDANTGRELWRSDVDVKFGIEVSLRPRSLRIPRPGLPSYALTEDVMVLSEGDDAVALDASTGELLWRIPGIDHRFVVMIEDAAVLVAREGLASFDQQTGEERWSWEADSIRSAAVHDDTIVVGDSDGLVALEAMTGVLRWETPLDGFPVDSAGPNVIVGTADRALAVNGASGEVVWDAGSLSGLAREPGTVTDGVLMVVVGEGPGDDSGQSEVRLMGIDVVNGEIRWTQVPEPISD